MKKGMKFDQSKLDFTLIPMEALEEEIKVLMVGAKKYCPNNWIRVPDAFNRYVKAIMRHMAEIITAINNDENPMDLKDPDTGLHPLAHIACDAHFALWFVKQAGKCDDNLWREKIESIEQEYLAERKKHESQNNQIG